MRLAEGAGSWDRDRQMLQFNEGKLDPDGDDDPFPIKTRQAHSAGELVRKVGKKLLLSLQEGDISRLVGLGKLTAIGLGLIT